MRMNYVYAMCIQEHWCNGNQIMKKNRGITVIGADLTECQQTRHGSEGVIIILSATTAKAWTACGRL